MDFLMIVGIVELQLKLAMQVTSITFIYVLTVLTADSLSSFLPL